MVQALLLPLHPAIAAAAINISASPAYAYFRFRSAMRSASSMPIAASTADSQVTITNGVFRGAGV